MYYIYYVYTYMQDGGVDGTGAPLPVSEEVKAVESELEIVKTLLEDLQSE